MARPVSSLLRILLNTGSSSAARKKTLFLKIVGNSGKALLMTVPDGEKVGKSFTTLVPTAVPSVFHNCVSTLVKERGLSSAGKNKAPPNAGRRVKSLGGVAKSKFRIFETHGSPANNPSLRSLVPAYVPSEIQRFPREKSKSRSTAGNTSALPRTLPRGPEPVASNGFF